MKKILFFLFFTGSVFSFSKSKYAYPVGMIDEHSIFFVHQKDINHLELWSIDVDSKELTKQLPAMYTPAGFQLLPDSKSFSFIDNGRIRIKALSKRSPKVIELERPLYEISLIHWIDNQSAYLNAKYHDKFGIFAINIDGDVKFLLHDHVHDYLYPQKVKDDLFFIERTKYEEKTTHAIKKTLFSTPNISEELFLTHDKSIAYLHMINDREGFFISFSINEQYEQDCLSFTYHGFYQINNQWETEQLFTFSVPTELFLLHNHSRLYESLLPLLPVYSNGKIYFSSCENEHMSLYEYDLSTKTQDCIAQSQSTHIFKLIVLENSIVCGGKVSKDKLVKTKLFNFLNLNKITDKL